MRTQSARPKSRLSKLRFESLEERTNPGAGTLDPTFGGDHKVTTSFGDFGHNANSTAIQADGKIVVAGSANDGFALARYNIDGTLDNSFGGDGMVTTAFQFGTINSIAIQANGKIVAAGSSNNGLDLDFTVVRYNADGSLDTSFSGDGKLTTAVGSADDIAQSVAIQVDGKIVVAGYSFIAGNPDFALVRYNTDGSLDTSFDGDGKLTTAIGSADDLAFAVAIQADGKIVAAGRADSGTDLDFALVRYNSNGSLDTSFDGDGKVTTPNPIGSDSIYALAIQADGKIVAAGQDGVTHFALARYNANGSLDTSFNGNGFVSIFNNAVAYGVAIQPDGKIVAAGDKTSGFELVALARFNPDGTLDTSFDGDGMLTTSFGQGDSVGRSIALQADGKIVVTGGAYIGGNSYFGLLRFKEDGSLDSLADGSGTLTSPIGVADDFGYAMAVQPDGKIVVAGRATTGADIDFALARYNPDASLDASFDGDGRVTTAFSPFVDIVNAIGLQADGKIVVAGYSFNGSNLDFAVARYNSDGSLDNSFDGDGKVTTDFSGQDDQAYGVAIQADGKIVLAGSCTLGGITDFGVVRYNTDGSLDNTFDGNGILNTDFSGSYDYAYGGVTLQDDGKIVVAGSAFSGNENFAIARYNPNGSLDTSFNGTGKQIIGVGGVDIATSVRVQPDGKIVVAGYANGLGTFDFVVTRLNPNGSLDLVFGADGVVITDLEDATDFGKSLVLQPDGKIVVAGDSFTGTDFDFAMVRYNPDGSLDNTFDGDGMLTVKVGMFDDHGYQIGLQSDGKLVVAGDSSNGSNADFALIRIRGDNHAPLTTPAYWKATEDSVLRVYDTDHFSDPDGDSLIATLMAGPTHGTLELAPYGTFVYTPDPEYIGPDSFMYKVTDRDGAFDIGSVMLNVVNDAADRLEIVTTTGIVPFTESVPLPSTPIVIDSNIKVGSAFEDTITSATVKITSGYVPKKDILTFATIGVIKGRFNARTGTLTLTGAARADDYEAALRTVKYTNPSATPVDGMRTIAFTVKDAAGAGDPSVRMLRVVGINTKPTLTLIGSALTYKARGKGLAVAGTLKITDLDNTRLMGATVSIGAGFTVGQDVLSVTTRAGITANYNAGVLTLTGNATLKTYLAVLRSLKFTTPIAAPAGSRTLSITVTDGLLTSDPVTRDVLVV